MDDGLLAGRNFHYKVIAVNELGRGLRAELTSFHTPETDDVSNTGGSPISTWFILPSVAAMVIKRKVRISN